MCTPIIAIMEWHRRELVLRELHSDITSIVHMLPRDIIDTTVPYLETDVVAFDGYTQPMRRGVLHGTCVKKFHDGMTEHQCVYVNGVQHGPDIKCYSNGVIHEMYLYQNGIREGPYYAYHMDGRQMFSGVYRSGELYGVHTHYGHDPNFRNIHIYSPVGVTGL